MKETLLDILGLLWVSIAFILVFFATCIMEIGAWCWHQIDEANRDFHGPNPRR